LGSGIYVTSVDLSGFLFFVAKKQLLDRPDDSTPFAASRPHTERAAMVIAALAADILQLTPISNNPVNKQTM